MAATKYTRDQLAKMPRPELNKLAKEVKFDPAGKTNEDIIRAVMKAQGGGSTPADPKAKAAPAPVAKAPTTAKAAPAPAAKPAAPAPAAKPAAKAPAKAAPPPVEEPTAEETTEEAGEFVTRAEFDELTDTVVQLSAVVEALTAGGATVTEGAAEEQQQIGPDDLPGLNLAQLRKACSDVEIAFTPTEKADDLRAKLLAAMQTGDEEPAAEEGASEEAPAEEETVTEEETPAEEAAEGELTEEQIAEIVAASTATAEAAGKLDPAKAVKGAKCRFFDPAVDATIYSAVISKVVAVMKGTTTATKVNIDIVGDGGELVPYNDGEGNPAKVSVADTLYNPIPEAKKAPAKAR